jgi:DNA-directed RNA polymerase specialized sigma24 family protein
MSNGYTGSGRRITTSSPLISVRNRRVFSPRRHDRASRDRRMHIDPVDLHFALIVVAAEARRLSICGMLDESDREDCASELMSRLLGSWHLYDHTRGPREAFINAVVTTQSVSLLRLRLAKKRGGGVYRVDVDPEEASDKRSAPVDRAQHVADLRMDFERVEPRLTQQQRVIASWLGRDKPTVVARILGMPRRTLRDELDRTRRVFCDAGLTG